MSKFKLGQRVTLNGDRFIDNIPRKALICEVRQYLRNDNLVSFGLYDYKRGAEVWTEYGIVREHRNGVTDKLLFASDFHEMEIEAGWLKGAI
jgi:hypothetical protein